MDCFLLFDIVYFQSGSFFFYTFISGVHIIYGATIDMIDITIFISSVVFFGIYLLKNFKIF